MEKDYENILRDAPDEPLMESWDAMKNVMRRLLDTNQEDPKNLGELVDRIISRD